MTDPAGGVGILVAGFAGLVSFLSPCVLPLVPGYLAVVTGVDVTRLKNAPIRRVLWPSLAFILTFSTIFILLGLTATSIGSGLNEYRPTLEKISAVIIIALGLVFIGSAFIANLNKVWHFEALTRRVSGGGGPIVVGAAFAIAWTPCVGPTLGAILSAAALAESVGRGALLLTAYSAGLAIPFLFTAVAFSRMTTAFTVIKRHFRLLLVAGGAVLVAMGLLIWTGEIVVLNIEAQKFLDRFGLNFFDDV